MKSILIRTDQNASIYETDDILGIYNYFDGIVETVQPRRLERPFCLAIDDSGMIKKLPLNAFGSYLYEYDKHGNPIAGDIFIMKMVWTDGGYDLEGLSDKEISYISSKYSLPINGKD